MFYKRKGVMCNRDRTNRLLQLIVLHENGQANTRQYARLIRECLHTWSASRRGTTSSMRRRASTDRTAPPPRRRRAVVSGRVPPLRLLRGPLARGTRRLALPPHADHWHRAPPEQRARGPSRVLRRAARRRAVQRADLTAVAVQLAREGIGVTRAESENELATLQQYLDSPKRSRSRRCACGCDRVLGARQRKWFSEGCRVATHRRTTRSTP